MMKTITPYQRGLLTTIVGVLILTPDALLIRLIEADHWTLLFWRGLFAATGFFILNACIEKTNPFQALRGLGKHGLLCALFFTCGNVCFVIAITHTLAANALVILASMPFLGALLAVIFIRKKIRARTWITIGLCSIGILVVFWGRFGQGNVVGDVFALLAALFTAATFIMINIKPSINTLAAVGLGVFMSAVFALLMGAEPAAVSGNDMMYLVLNGGLLFPIAMGMITYGPKQISAPEVSLIMLLETVLGPVWVWWILSEIPPQQTFIGGAIVVGAIAVNAMLGFKSGGKEIRQKITAS